jgi:hypothetical protein
MRSLRNGFKQLAVGARRVAVVGALKQRDVTTSRGCDDDKKVSTVCLAIIQRFGR